MISYSMQLLFYCRVRIVSLKWLVRWRSEDCCKLHESMVVFWRPWLISRLFRPAISDSFSLLKPPRNFVAWSSRAPLRHGKRWRRGKCAVKPWSRVRVVETFARYSLITAAVNCIFVAELMPSVSAFKMYSEVFPYWGKMASANGVFGQSHLSTQFDRLIDWLIVGSYLREISTLSDCSYTIRYLFCFSTSKEPQFQIKSIRFRETLEEDEWCETATGTPPDTSEPPMEQVIDELNLQFSDIFTDNDRDDFSDSRNTQNLVASGNPYDTSQISIEEIDNWRKFFWKKFFWKKFRVVFFFLCNFFSFDQNCDDKEIFFESRFLTWLISVC